MKWQFYKMSRDEYWAEVCVFYVDELVELCVPARQGIDGGKKPDSGGIGGLAGETADARVLIYGLCCAPI